MIEINLPFQLKSKIIYKIIALLALPVLMQFAIGIPLVWLTQENDELERNEKELIKVIGKDGHLIVLWDSVTANFGTYAMHNEEWRKKEGVPVAAVVQENFDELLRETEDDPSLRRNLIAYRDNAAELLASISKMGGSDMIGMQRKLERMRAFSTLAKNITDRAMARIEKTGKKLEDAQRQHASRRENAKLLTIILVFVEILISVGVALWVVRNLTQRLDVLIENAYRLPRNVPLEQKVKGSDELSYLDGALHEAEQYLSAANEQRTMIMEMIAHDMRSPLMAAQIASELIGQVSENASEPIKRNIVTIQRNQNIVINLVNDLLTIDRLEAGALELNRVNYGLKALIEEAKQTVETIAAAKEIRIQTRCLDGFFVNVDKDRIVQVITNLVTNAVKFSPTGSSILIEGSEGPRFLQICIIDQGPGLPPGSEKRIFEKFQQTSKEHSKKGYGLGLAICKMLVELHGGTISAQGLPERGSQFCFSLPRGRLERPKLG